MTSSNSNGGDAKHDGTTVITVLFDKTTLQVSLGIHGVAVALAQMMIHEASVQLDILRRQAAAMELRKQLQDHATSEALAASIFGQR